MPASMPLAILSPPAWPRRPDGSNLPVAEWNTAQRAEFLRAFAPTLFFAATLAGAHAPAASSAARPEPSALQQLRARQAARSDRAGR